MNTELPYDEVTAADFRVEIAKVAHKANAQFGELINTERKLTGAEPHLRMAALLTANFGWSLVAIIRWLEQTYGPEAAWRAAAMAQEVMTNGGNSFCEDIDLGGDDKATMTFRPNVTPGGEA